VSSSASNLEHAKSGALGRANERTSRCRAASRSIREAATRWIARRAFRGRPLGSAPQIGAGSPRSARFGSAQHVAACRLFGSRPFRCCKPGARRHVFGDNGTSSGFSRAHNENPEGICLEAPRAGARLCEAGRGIRFARTTQNCNSRSRTKCQRRDGNVRETCESHFEFD